MKILVAALLLTACDQQMPNDRTQGVRLPELVEIEPGVHQYRRSGEFLRNGHPVNAPIATVRFRHPFQITKYQISESDYGLCVQAGACEEPFRRGNAPVYAADRPVTGVSHLDALDYASWLTTQTGMSWRLPSDAEWAYAAGSRFFDDAKNIENDAADPSKRMLSKYRQTFSQDREADPEIRSRGAFGANEKGVHDLSGNVWEWTDSCYQRWIVKPNGKLVARNPANCGVRVVEGRHRSYMTFFIKDAKSGGCAVGTPPDHLGFRLVLDEPRFPSMRWLGNLFNQGA